MHSNVAVPSGSTMLSAQGVRKRKETRSRGKKTGKAPAEMPTPGSAASDSATEFSDDDVDNVHAQAQQRSDDEEANERRAVAHVEKPS